MKRLLLSLSFCLLAPTAFAADAAEPIVVADPTFTWTGAYVGGQIGYTWAESTMVTADTLNVFVPLDPEGVSGGIYGGYNYQFSNRIVAGLEGDFQFTDAEVSDVFGYFTDAPGPTLEHFGAEIKWDASLRARLGYAFDRFLPFVTAGAAFARYNYTGDGPGGSSPLDHSETRTGWTVGAGADFALTEHLIFRAEYRYSDFGSEVYDDPFWSPWDVDLTTQDVRLGVAYKF